MQRMFAGKQRDASGAAVFLGAITYRRDKPGVHAITRGSGAPGTRRRRSGEAASRPVELRWLRVRLTKS